MKKRIVILATGGTIVSSGSTASQLTGYSQQGLTAEDVAVAVPGLSDAAELEFETVSSVGSGSITFPVWKKLLERTQFHAERPEVSGIVITHGTDTMEETAFFLNLVLKTEKPVILTGAMRPATALSADGPLNLYQAVVLAASGKTAGFGVVIAMNGEIVSARDAAKTNTSAPETFQGKITGFMGTVIGGEIDILSASTRPHTLKSEFFPEDFRNIQSFPRVLIAYGFIDGEAEEFRLLRESEPDAIVFAAPGHGTLSVQTEPEVKKAADDGIVICRSSRTGSGPVLPSKERWQEMGVLYSRTLSPQKARILLQLGILKYGRNRKELQRLLSDY